MARSVGLSKAQVIMVAAELADEHGLDRITLAQIAARCNIKLPSLYHYVSGIEAVRRELALLAIGELARDLSRAVLGKAGDDAVIALSEAYRGYVLAHPGRYAASIPAPGPDDEELQRASREIVAIGAAVLAPYQLDSEAMIHAIRGFRALAHGFATLEAAGGFGIPIDTSESFRRLVKAFVRGLRRSSSDV